MPAPDMLIGAINIDNGKANTVKNCLTGKDGAVPDTARWVSMLVWISGLAGGHVDGLVPRLHDAVLYPR